MAKTHIQDRSTYWIQGGYLYPDEADYRYYWIIYYDQSESTSSNNRTKIIVDYYEQTYGGDIGGPGTITSPSGTSTCYINGSSIGSISSEGQWIFSHTGNSLVYLGTRSTYIQHNDDGTGSFTFRGNGFGFSTSTSPYDVPTIPRSSVLSNISSFNVDDGVTVNATKYASSFYDQLKIYIGSTLIATRNNFKSGKVTFSSAELDKIYTNITSSSGTIKFELSTYSDSGYSNKIGSSSTKSATGKLKIVLPTFEDFTYQDINSTTSKLTSGGTTSDVIVKGYSKLKVTIPVANKAIVNTRKATISHYLIEGNQVAYSSSAAVTKEITNYSKKTIAVTAVDSRGSSSPTITKSPTFINYSKITKNDNYTYSRNENGIGEQVTITFSGKWWNGNFGSVANTVTASYKYKKSSASSYTSGPSLTLTKSSNTYSFNGVLKDSAGLPLSFDISESYDIIVTVKDKLSSVTIPFVIHSGEPAIAIYKNKAALGAMYDTTVGGTQIWGDAYVNGIGLYNVGDILVTGNSTNPSSDYAGTWELRNKCFAWWYFIHSVDNGEEEDLAKYVTSSENATFDSIAVVRNYDSIYIRLHFINLVPLTDSSIQLGTIDLSKLGMVTPVFLGIYGQTAVSDGGQGSALVGIDPNGNITSSDINRKDGGTEIPANCNFYYEITYHVPVPKMNNSHCNLFYWVRKK